MNPLNQTKEKREAVPNGVSRVGIAALGVLLQVLWIVWAALKLTRYYAWVQLAISVLAWAGSLLGFAEIIGTVYPVCGYISGVFLVFMVIHFCRARKQEKETAEK